MKKNVFPVLLLFLLGVSACSSAQAATTPVGNDLPVAAKLAVGTFRLDGTEQAVTGEQAKELLVMWQVYQELGSSDTAAQAEIDGLVEQIQETMTADQMNAIQSMNLSQQDVFSLMQEQGGDFIQVRQSSNGSSTQSSSGFAPPDGGGMPGGAGGPPGGDMAGGVPPDGGMAGMGSAGASSSTDQTQGTGTGPGAGSLAVVPTPLVSALIQYLEQIASA